MAEITAIGITLAIIMLIIGIIDWFLVYYLLNDDEQNELPTRTKWAVIFLTVKGLVQFALPMALFMSILSVR